MTAARADAGFLSGLVAGILAGLAGAAMVMLATDSLAPAGATPAWTIAESLDWAYRNLGFSLPVFAAVLWLYLRSLSQLRGRIARGAPLEEVAQADHLTDTWTSLFFGVGVIWTAIGMRGALLYALGDPSASVDDGAFAVLQRMVNGGILVALSTTIFGGIGGYLMRVAKTVTAGAELKRYYDEHARRAGAEIQETLRAIEAHLAYLARRGDKDKGHGPAPLDEIA